MGNWVNEFLDTKYAKYVSTICSSCGKLIDYRRCDEEDYRIKKYNFCPLCRDPKGDAIPKDGEAHETWALADNGWVDCGCSSCGHTENIDFPGHLGYNNCPVCGILWNRNKGEKS